MNPPLLECFPCPRCARNVVRPDGATTWHSCGEIIRRTTHEDRLCRLYEAPILEALHASNEIVGEAELNG